MQMGYWQFTLCTPVSVIIRNLKFMRVFGLVGLCVYLTGLREAIPSGQKS